MRLAGAPLAEGKERARVRLACFSPVSPGVGEFSNLDFSGGGSADAWRD